MEYSIGNGAVARLCERGEAECGTDVNFDGRLLELCSEPAAVAILWCKGTRWEFACRKHFGETETDELRSKAEKEL